MQNEHMLSGSVRKRAQMADQIEHTQTERRKLVTDLVEISVTMRILDPNADTREIPDCQHRPRHAALQGEIMRHVTGTLRIAVGPITSRGIARGMIQGRGR